ncbi:MAG: DHA2 family efflux MFS transporter permease subunit [Methylohalobius crimeensis]
MAMPRRNAPFALVQAGLMLGHVLVLFNAAVYVAAIPKAAGALGVAPSFGTWAQTYFMMGWALSVPLTSWLAKKFGRVRILLAGLAGFLLASAICAWAPEFSGFLLGRVLLGLPSGLVLLLSQNIALSHWPPEKKLTGVSLWGMAALAPLTLGGVIGGWITDELGWRWLFYLNLAVGGVVAFMVTTLLDMEKATRPVWRFDKIGYGLLVIVMAGTHTLLNLGNDWDWWRSDLLVGVASISVVALLYGWIWELGTPYPAVDLRLLRQRNFLIGVTCLAVGFFFIQGLFSFLIVRLQLIFDYSTWLAGLVFVPLLLAKPMIAFTHQLMRNIDLRLLISLDLLGFALVFSWIGRFDRDAWLDQLFWPICLEGLCLGVFFAPLTALILAGVPPRYHPRVLEQANVLRIAAGSWGISSMGVIAYQRSGFHRVNLVDQFTLADPRSQALLDKFSQAGFSPAAAQTQLEKTVAHRAAILGFDDAFLLAAMVFVGLAVLVWLANPVHLPVRLDLRRKIRMLWEEEQLEEP